MMINKQEYLNKFHELKKKLQQEGKEFRLRHKTEKEFLAELNDIVHRYENAYFQNDNHREKSMRSSLSLLFQKNLTVEEMKDQMNRHKETQIESFAKDAPEIKTHARNIQLPLTVIKLGQIYRWLYRNQISLNDLNFEVLKAFQKSKQYDHWLKVKASRKSK